MQFVLKFEIIYNIEKTVMRRVSIKARSKRVGGGERPAAALYGRTSRSL